MNVTELKCKEIFLGFTDDVPVLAATGAVGPSSGGNLARPQVPRHLSLVPRHQPRDGSHAEQGDRADGELRLIRI
jgi:hypothetical protein